MIAVVERCSFCAKDAPVFSKRSARICADCARMCLEIVDGMAGASREPSPEQTAAVAAKVAEAPRKGDEILHARRQAGAAGRPYIPKRDPSGYRCSFCDRHRDDAGRLVSGPGGSDSTWGVLVCRACLDEARA